MYFSDRSMKTRLPPTAALRALEAAARHLSYTKAADELHITQSAVSHQIRHTEELWGVKLFERRGRRLVLTQAGQAIAPVVRDFIERIGNTLKELAGTENRSALKVTLLQSFAFKWLVHRLGHFNEKHPDIDVWISTTEDLLDFSIDNVDVGIRLGYGDWPRLHVTPLLREYVFPVCSPRLLEQLGEPAQPEDLLKYPLLKRHSDDICPRWRDWFSDAGVQLKKMPKGTKFPETSMAIQAAIDDQGIALARSAHVADDLASGRLVKLLNVYSPSAVSYFVVCLKGRETEPDICAFREWILEEADIAQHEFDAVIANSIPKDAVA